ncbi:hypothetical protein GGR21_002719 [Dysgonomonas hofstadii]|uniref:Phosphate-selective porin O and P n=1 Tax=Dysgonomonas hofstadii TaxID=637886 RepID=A0A840CN40_9BACT|nr:hypothetical protein [Dysgonomonas hofstadii]MBB4036806.1 hypothetical protein [Dysgonomonas hofstadii]
MKKIFIICISVLISGGIFAQGKSHGKADFRLGNGLDIQLNDGDYTFNLGGFIQAGAQYLKDEGSKAENRFDIKYGYLSLAGNAKKEKVSFLLQLDFADSKPLLDAWIAYKPIKFLTISAGQKQTFTNNREMTFLENRLSMVDRSIMSRNLASTGRELGLFLESEFMLGNVGILPQFAVTTGDGRNSFGSSSTDVDKGGLKYGGRFDIAPLGMFTPGNDKIGADLAHEKSPKVKVGVAGSYNSGVSNAFGEGHGDFALYTAEGKEKLPDYRKLYADIMFKFQGFSLLGEYGNTSATRIKGLHTATNGTGELLPGDISSFLYLGDSYNIQMGYALRNGFALDLRYTKIKPEYEDSESVLKDVSAYDVTLTKYFVDNRLKIQGGFSYLDYKKENNIRNHIQAELLLQVIF